MEFIIEFFREVVFVYLFSFPGAVIRWVLTGKKRLLKEVLKDDGYLNATIAFLFIGAVIGIIAFINTMI